MAKKRRKKKKSILLDWKHILGWIITITAIVLVFHLLKVHGLHDPWYHLAILGGLIIIIDYLKHKAKLQ
jgi:hypothetical protein